MTEDVMASDWCFGVPIDHRLKPLLSQPQKSSRTGLGSHLATLRRYGGEISRSESRSRTTSENGINFGEWLARPMRQGGLVIALLQPAPNQQYTPNVEHVKAECATLYWLDNILQVIGRSTLGKTSCFDAFLFRLERPRNGNCPPEMRQAYAVFLQMIRQKKPDVILGAWQPPKGFGEVQYCSKGVGAADETETIVVGSSPIQTGQCFPAELRYQLPLSGDGEPSKLQKATYGFRASGQFESPSKICATVLSSKKITTADSPQHRPFLNRLTRRSAGHQASGRP